MKQTTLFMLCISCVFFTTSFAQEKSDLDAMLELYDLNDSPIIAFMEIQADIVATENGLTLQNESVTGQYSFDEQGENSKHPDLREEIVFDEAGNMVEKQIYDSIDNLVSDEIFIYNLQNVLVKSVLSLYNAEGYVARKIIRTNDDEGTLVEESDTAYQADGQSAQNIYKYNEQGEWIEVYRSFFDGTSSRLIYEYDKDGNSSKVLRYNSDGLINYDLFEYDGQGNQTASVKFNADDSLLEAFRSTYDSSNNRIESKWFDSQNENIATTNFKHDEKGNVLEEIMRAKDGAIYEHKKYTYNENDDWVEISSFYNDVLVNRTERSYDEQGNRLDSIRYDAEGEILGMNICTYEYDAYSNWTRKECVDYSDKSGSWQPDYGISTLELKTRIIGYYTQRE